MKPSILALATCAALLAVLPLPAARLIRHGADGRGPLFVPSVKSYTARGGFYRLPAELKIAFPAEAASEAEQLKRIFAKYAPAIKLIPSGGDLTLELDGAPRNADDESYTLSVTSKGVRLAAATRAGLFRGVMTVANLLLNDPEKLPCCEIQDAPVLRKRGVFMVLRDLTDRDVPEFLELLAVFAELKLNTLSLQFDENLPVADSPFTVRKKPVLSAAALKRILDTAAAYHMSITPVLQCVTHCRWLNNHPDYAEKIINLKSSIKRNSWSASYCPRMKLGREMTEWMLRRTIELLKPKCFDLCLDEFPACHWERCDHCPGGHTAEEMRDEVLYFVNLVKSLGITPVMAQDSLRKSKTVDGTLTLENLPKDIIINVWDYEPVPSATQLEFFKERGFTALTTSSWMFYFDNMAASPLLTARLGVDENHITYWGYQRTPTRADMVPRAAAGTVIGAQFMWNQDNPDYLALPYDPAREFYLRAGLAPVRNTNYTPVDLGKVFDCRLGDDPEFPVFAPGGSAEARDLLARTNEKFRLGAAADGTFAAAGIPREKGKSIRIPLNRKAEALSFLLIASRPGDDRTFSGAREERSPRSLFFFVIYDDKTKVQQQMIFRGAVTDWNSESSGRECRFVIRGNDRLDRMYNFCVYDWRNPHPEKTIRQIVMAGDRRSKSGTALLALSAAGATDAPAAGRIDEAAVAKLPLYQGKPFPVISDLARFRPGPVPEAILRTDNFTVAPISRRIVTEHGQSMIEFTVPPAVPGGRTRISVECPLPPDAQVQSLYGEYELLDAPPNLKVHSGFYALPREGYPDSYRVLYKFHQRQRFGRFHRIIFPLKAMIPDGTAPFPDGAVGAIRMSLWLSGHEKPVRLRFGKVGFSAEPSEFFPEYYSNRIPDEPKTKK